MSKMFKAKLSGADEIAEKASRGEDISSYFTNKFTIVRPIRGVNLDLTQGMLREPGDDRPSKPRPKRKLS